MTDIPERIGVYRFENGHMIAIPLPMTFLNHPWESGEAEYIRADLAILIPPEGPERDALVDRMAEVIFDHEGVNTFITARAALEALIVEK